MRFWYEYITGFRRVYHAGTFNVPRDALPDFFFFLFSLFSKPRAGLATV